MNCSRFKYITAVAFICFFALFTIPTSVECANNKKTSAPTTATIQHEPTIEEVTAKQLERLLAEKDYVAVYWCKFTNFPSLINCPIMDHQSNSIHYGLTKK